MSLGIIRKGPDEEPNFGMDWKDFLDTSRNGTENDTISTATWAVPDGLTLGTTSKTDTGATARITGGNIGQSYDVTCTIVLTTSGETYKRTGTIHVVAL